MGSAPGEGSGLWQADVLQNAVNVVACDVGDGLRMVVEGGDEGEDGCACFGDRGHIADVDEAERGFADAENQASAFLEADVGCALDEIAGETVSDAAESSHGAGKNDHRVYGRRA